MKERIDLIKSKKLSRILAGKEPIEDRHAKMLAEVRKKMSENVDPGLETPSYLFFFERKHYHVQGILKKIMEGAVSKLLDENKDTKIYFLCAANICPMPNALSGRKKVSKKVKDKIEAAQFMTKTSGIKITVNDL